MKEKKFERKFSLGELSMTRNVREQLPMEEVIWALARHMSGDWGDLWDEDKRLNDEALKNGGRLLSVYHSDVKGKFYIITEGGRSATTVLFPWEY